MDKDELEAYYKAMVDTFATPGWKLFLEKDVKTAIENINEFGIESTKDEQNLYHKKGQLAALRWLEGLEYTMSSNFNRLMDEQDEEEDVV